jgi:hypothetical protein
MKPIGWNFLNDSFNSAADHLPIMRAWPKSSAAIIGFTVPFTCINVANYFLDNYAPKIHNNRYFKNFEKILGYGCLAAGGLYILSDPQGFINLQNQYPVYMPGVEAIVAGTSAALLQDGYRRNMPKDIEEIIDRSEDDKGISGGGG